MSEKTTAEEQARELKREILDRMGGISALDNARSFGHFDVSVLGSHLVRMWDLLTSTSRRVGQLEATADKQQRRIGQLESSNGALMVDRDRGIRAATERAAAAEHLAAEMAAKAGVELADDAIARRVADDNEQTYRLENEIQRAGDLRQTVVGFAFQLEEKAKKGQGLTPDELMRVARALKRANGKAMGRAK